VADTRDVDLQELQLACGSSQGRAGEDKTMSLVTLHENVEWRISCDGVVLRRGQSRNLVTQVGDRLYAERGAAIASPPATPTGMKLGTGSTAVSKSGAGAALTTYLADSHLAFDSTYPQSSLSGSARRITYICTFGPGKATSASPITEAVIVNAALTDATSAEAATIARTLLTGIGSKGAGETLTVTWTHDLMGA
jgi:hypothetical protein